MSVYGNPTYSNYGNYGYGSQRVYSTGFGNPMFGQVNNYSPYVTGQNYAPFSFGNNYSPYVNQQYYGQGNGNYNPYANTNNYNQNNNYSSYPNYNQSQNTTAQNNNPGWYSASAGQVNVSADLVASLETKLSLTKGTFDTSLNGAVSMQELIIGLNNLGAKTQNGQALAQDADVQKQLAAQGIMRNADGIYYEVGQMPIYQNLQSAVQANLGITFSTLDSDSNGMISQNELVVKLNSLPAGSYNAQYAANNAEFANLLKQSGIERDSATGVFKLSGSTAGTGQSASTAGHTALVGDTSFFATKYNINISSYDTQIQYGLVSRQELIAGLNTINPASANGQAMATDTQFLDFLKQNNITRTSDGKYYETGQRIVNQDLLNSVQSNLDVNIAAMNTDGMNGISQQELITKLNSFTAGSPNANYAANNADFKKLLAANDIQFNSTSGQFEVASSTGQATNNPSQTTLAGDSQFFATRYNINLSSYDTQVRDGVVSKQELIQGLNTINPASANGQTMATDAELDAFLKQNNITRASNGTYYETGQLTVSSNLVSSVQANLGVTQAALETDGRAGISQQELIAKLNSFTPGSPNANFAANDTNFKNLLTTNGIQLDSATGQYVAVSGLANTNTVTTPDTSVAAATKQNLLEALASNLGVSFTGSNQATLEARMEGQVISKGGPDISNNNGLISDAEIAAYANSKASKSNAAAHDALEAALLAAGFKKENDLIVANVDSPVLGVVGGSVQKDGKGTGR